MRELRVARQTRQEAACAASQFTWKNNAQRMRSFSRGHPGPQAARCRNNERGKLIVGLFPELLSPAESKPLAARLPQRWPGRRGRNVACRFLSLNDSACSHTFCVRGAQICFEDSEEIGPDLLLQQ